MSFIDASLLPQENVLYRTRLHWIVFVPPVVWLVLAVMLAFQAGAFGQGVAFAAAVCLVLFLATGTGALIDYFTSEFGVTNRRVLAKMGWIRRDTIEVLLRSLEAIQVSQSILGRVFGYGTVVIIGTGGTREVFHKVADPFALRKVIQAQVAQAGQGVS